MIAGNPTSDFITKMGLESFPLFLTPILSSHPLALGLSHSLTLTIYTVLPNRRGGISRPCFPSTRYRGSRYFGGTRQSHGPKRWGAGVEAAQKSNGALGFPADDIRT